MKVFLVAVVLGTFVSLVIAYMLVYLPGLYKERLSFREADDEADGKLAATFAVLSRLMASVPEMRLNMVSILVMIAGAGLMSYAVFGVPSVAQKSSLSSKVVVTEAVGSLPKSGSWKDFQAMSSLVTGDGSGQNVQSIVRIDGATVWWLNNDLSEYFESVEEGALVLSVDKRSRIAKAGVQPGDVITEINGVSLNDIEDLRGLSLFFLGTSANLDGMKLLSFVEEEYPQLKEALVKQTDGQVVRDTYNLRWYRRGTLVQDKLIAK